MSIYLKVFALFSSSDVCVFVSECTVPTLAEVVVAPAPLCLHRAAAHHTL